MAYIKVSSTRNVTAALRYGEHEKDVLHNSIECENDTETAIWQYRGIAKMWNQSGGVQGHIIIQSFKGQECTQEQANKIGIELAKEIASGFMAMVYTHKESKGGNIHNHIVINAVNSYNGKKFDNHSLLQKAREKSDKICQQHKLSIITKRKAEMRYTQAEVGLMSKNRMSWKDELRSSIERAIFKARDIEEFKRILHSEGIKVNERQRKRDNTITWTYQHKNNMKCRAYRLGNNYTRAYIIAAINDKPNILSQGKIIIEQINQRRQEEEQKEKLKIEKDKRLILEKIKEIYDRNNIIWSNSIEREAQEFMEKEYEKQIPPSKIGEIDEEISWKFASDFIKAQVRYKKMLRQI